MNIKNSSREVIHAERDGLKLRFREGRKSAGVWTDDGTVDIEIELAGKTVTDYDGCFELPTRVVNFLRAEGFRFGRFVLPS